MNIQIEPAWGGGGKQAHFGGSAVLTVEMVSAFRRVGLGRPRLNGAQLAVSSRHFEAAGVSVEAAREWQASHLRSPGFGGFHCQWQTLMHWST